MTMQERPEKPEEYDRRMSAPYDFEPGCEIKGCEQRASLGVRCIMCKNIRVLLCGAHAGISQRRTKDVPVKCEVCGAEAKAQNVLEWKPLAGWFA